MARLILDPTLEYISGRYFHVHTETRSSRESYDHAKAQELWEASVAMVQLTPAELLLPASVVAPL